MFKIDNDCAAKFRTYVKDNSQNEGFVDLFPKINSITNNYCILRLFIINLKKQPNYKAFESYLNNDIESNFDDNKLTEFSQMVHNTARAIVDEFKKENIDVYDYFQANLISVVDSIFIYPGTDSIGYGIRHHFRIKNNTNRQKEWINYGEKLLNF